LTMSTCSWYGSGMSEFYKFAGDHPILTFALASVIVGAVVRVIPWSKKGED